MSKIEINSFELNKILNNDGVIAFVTDTVWGLGCRVDRPAAVEKIYEIKGRDKSKPLILMSNDIKNLYPYVNNISSKAEKLIEQYFPGALTLILNKSDLTPDYVTAKKNTVGIRVPDNQFFKELCSNIEGHVLATTSANFSGEKSSLTYEDTKKSLESFVDIIFEDYGFKCKGIESTVVSLVNDEIKILRQGMIKILIL